MLGAAGPSALWYLTRATGAVSLVLLTVSLALGIANVGRLQRPGWPRFVVEGVHRNVSLLAIVVLAVHIVTSLLDPFAGIRLIDAFIPFTGSYRPIWLGLGAFASDLLLAVAITSMVRRRLGHAIWRATHWLAYLCWPVAVMHTVGTGSDVKQLWLLALTAACIVTVIVAVWVRIGVGWPVQRRLRAGAVAASIALPAAFVAWMPGGPLGKDWARRAGTPAAILAKASGASVSSTSSTTIGSFQAAVTGTLSQSAAAGGQVAIDISLSAPGAPLTQLHVQIVGPQTSGGGVQMSSSAVTAGTAANPGRFSGAVTSLSGTSIVAAVGSTTQSLTIALALQINAQTGAVAGTLTVTPR